MRECASRWKRITRRQDSGRSNAEASEISDENSPSRQQAISLAKWGFRDRKPDKQSSFPKSLHGIVTVWPLRTETLKGLKAAELIGLTV
jgi:hypothetical protein